MRYVIDLVMPLLHCFLNGSFVSDTLSLSLAFTGYDRNNLVSSVCAFNVQNMCLQFAANGVPIENIFLRSQYSVT